MADHPPRVLAAAITILITMIKTTSANDFKATKIEDRFHWQFYEEKNIIQLSSKNAEYAFEKLPHMFVMFYKLGCRATNKFYPTFLRLGARMKEEVHPIAVAQYEVSDNLQEVNELYGVEESPTFIYFRNGKPLWYKGVWEVGKAPKRSNLVI